MKKIYTMILMAAILFLTSCEGHKEPVDYSLQVGNILCADGSVIPPSTYEGRNDGVAVVAYVGTEEDAYKIIAIGIDEIGKGNFTNTNKELGSNDGDKNTITGKENTAIMVKAMLEDETVKYPAVQLVTSYNKINISGWHLPSCGELGEVYKNKRKINSSLSLIGGKELETQTYISSTQDGRSSDTKAVYCFCVNMKDGIVTSVLNSEKIDVRPFIAIR
jgi:hypothetical protein